MNEEYALFIELAESYQEFLDKNVNDFYQHNLFAWTFQLRSPTNTYLYESIIITTLFICKILFKMFLLLMFCSHEKSQT